MKINYINNRVKAMVGCVLIFSSLTGCVKNGEKTYDNFTGYDELETSINIDDDNLNSDSKEVIDVSIGYSCSSKDNNYSDDYRLEMEEVSGEDRVKFSVCDTNSSDYISGIDYVVKDSKGNIIDKFTSDQNYHIIKGLTVGEEYTIEELNVPIKYGEETYIYRFTMENFDYSTSFDATDLDNYYFVNDIYVQKEKTIDQELKNEGKFEDGYFYVGACELNEGFIDGVTFLVTSEDNKLVDQWVSSNTKHIVYNLADGKYTVRVVEPKDNYVLENVVGRFSEKENENCSNSYDVYIKDGIFVDDEYADDCSWGVLFYFSNSKNKNIDKTLSNYKSKVLSKNNHNNGI